MDLGLGEDDGNLELKINENYAKGYSKWRKSEELQKLKDKYGDDVEESSTSEEEDEDAVELTEKVEEDFYKTLAYLKEKNPKIYDDKERFFAKNDSNDTPALKPEKVASLSMAAYHRKVLLETGGVIEEETNDQDISGLPYVQQEKALKESFKKALAKDESDDDEDLLKPKVKSSEDKEKEESDYRMWLAGQTENAPKESSELKGLRDYWADPKLDEGEKFLRDYILNQSYLEKGESSQKDYFMSDSEEDTCKEQEEFERKFNFRFEEPDQDFIKRYPRTIEKSMRKVDDRRKKHREDVKERKLKERAIKDEELKRLKALKRAEIMEKIKKLQEVTGNDDMTFMNEDVDGEFDPNEHDKRMSELFDEDYYKIDADDKKPEFPDLDEELEIENWNDWNEEATNNREAEPHCDDADFVMDCDYDPSRAMQEENQESTKRRRKKRHSKFAEALAKPKPKFDPTNANFEQYLDEYYSLNYEDLIGDIPCRFKYRKTVPNDFGLTIEEILAAPDKELNRWASSKKIMRRRPDHVELYDVKAYRQKAKDFNKKKQCLPSLYNPPETEDPDVSQTSEEITNVPAVKPNHASAATGPAKTKKIKKKKKKEHLEVAMENPSDESALQGGTVDMGETKNLKRDINAVENVPVPAAKHTPGTTRPAKTKKIKKKKEHVENAIDNPSDECALLSGIDGVIKQTKNVKRNFNLDDAPVSASEAATPAQTKKLKKSNGHVESAIDNPANRSALALQEKKHKNLLKRKINAIEDAHNQLTSKKMKNGPVSSVESQEKKKKNKNKVVHQNPISAGSSSDAGVTMTRNGRDHKTKRRNDINGRRRQRSTTNSVDASAKPVTSLSDSRLKSYGLNPKKYKNKLKYGTQSRKKPM